MKSYNQIDMRGKIYSHALEERDTGKGPAIMGTVTLQVDEQGTTVEGRFYANQTYSSGSPNRTYGVLEDLMNGEYKTVLDDGQEEADWLSMTGNIDVSYFKGRDGAAKSVDDLARSQKIRGSFLNANKKHEYKNRWNCDMYITKIDDVEADEERGIDRFVRVRGYVVDEFREMLNEVAFEAHSPAAMNYILGITASIDQPYAVKMWGSRDVVTMKSVKKNAFDEDEINEYEVNKWTITGMDPDAYPFGDESVMTVDNWKEFMGNLNNHKEEILEGNDDKNSGNKPKLSF